MIITCTDCGARHESGDVHGMTEPNHFQWNKRHDNPDRAALQQENAELRKALAWAMHGIGRPRRIARQNEAHCDSYEHAAALLARHPAPRSDAKPDHTPISWTLPDPENMTWNEMRAELSAAGLPIDEHLNWTGLTEAVVKLRAK